MDVGMFLMPAHPKGRDLYEAVQWDLQMLRWADELGYTEAWIGEHFTSEYEPVPAPDLLIAQALTQTSQIRLAPGAHLLPYHHPAELAHRVAFLDHLSQGRLMFGVGSSGLPGDWGLFNIDGFGGENRDMTNEALDIILKLWTEDGPWTFEGKYWTVNKNEAMFTHLEPWLSPKQTPHPPIGVAGLNAPSPTLEMAGERGYIPMSLNLGVDYVKKHWECYEEAAVKAGRTPDRRDWRLAKEVMVADTDEEAFELAVNGPMGQWAEEYSLDIFGQFDFLHYFKHDQSVPNDQVTPAYLADNNWLVGSVDTVVQKLEALFNDVGGFGTMLVLGFDYAASGQSEAWQKSMHLLKNEVMPRVPHLDAGAKAAA